MEEWQNASVESNGINIHYHRTGGKGPTLLLIHGFTDNGLCWSRVAREMQAHYDLVMLDSRGHGLSDKPHQGYSTDDYAEDVAGVIAALNLGKTTLVGHSVGATTAAYCCRQIPATCSRSDIGGPYLARSTRTVRLCVARKESCHGDGCTTANCRPTANERSAN